MTDDEITNRIMLALEKHRPILLAPYRPPKGHDYPDKAEYDRQRRLFVSIIVESCRVLMAEEA